MRPGDVHTEGRGSGCAIKRAVPIHTHSPGKDWGIAMGAACNELLWPGTFASARRLASGSNFRAAPRSQRISELFLKLLPTISVIRSEPKFCWVLRNTQIKSELKRKGMKSGIKREIGALIATSLFAASAAFLWSSIRNAQGETCQEWCARQMEQSLATCDMSFPDKGRQWEACITEAGKTASEWTERCNNY